MEFFESPNKFSQHIEKKAQEKKQTLFETLLEFCTLNHIEPEDIKGMISKSLRDKIEVEVRKDNMLPRETAKQLEE